MIKVLHIYKSYLPESNGGVEQAIFQLASQSRCCGIDATVLSLSRSKVNRFFLFQTHIAYKVHQFFEIKSCGFSLSFFYRFLILAKNADLIHCHYPWPFMDLVFFITCCNKPIILTYHSDIIRQHLLLKLYKPLRNWFLSKVNRIIATSPNYLFSSDVLIKYQDKVTVIPIGLNEALYPKSNINLEERWKKIVGEKFFLFIGVLRYYKGLEILLEALAIKEFPVVIVGSGPMEIELKLRAASLGLNKIIFLGHLSEEDKVALLRISYSIVFPSHLRSEAFGISLLEGAMFGKPLISSEIGTGTSYINIHDQTGLVIDPSNPKSLQNAMELLWSNPEIAENMGRAARARYLECFTAQKMMESHVESYKEILGITPPK